MIEKGMVVGGRYHLIRQIGEGGMATVWEAEHLTLGSPVAVKFLHAQGPHVDQLVERFMREARVAASVRHRNVVEIMDFGLLDDTTPYMVMELLEGESLAVRVDAQGPMDVTEVAYLGALTLRGLAAVHAAGIVHRDLKPDNVFLVEDEDGTFPKLLDFGVSKRAERAAGTDITQEGVLIGTPDYMSPEQARGLRDIDQRTDVWSMGVILFEMLAGRLPFVSENVGDLIVMITTEDPPPLRGLRAAVPEEFAAVVERAMSKERENRFQDAREMRIALMAACQDLGLGFGDPDSGVSFVSELPTAPSRPDLPQIPATPDAEPPLEGPPPEPKLRTPSMAERPAPVPHEARERSRLAETVPAMVDTVATPPPGDLALSLSPPPAKRRWGLLVGFVLLAAALGAGTAYYLDRGELPFIEQAVDPSTTDLAGTPWEPATGGFPVELLDAGDVDAGATIHVSVVNVPEDGVLRIDGVPVEGQTARIPAGAWTYTVDVVLSDAVVWRVEHPANVDGEYEVWVYDGGVPPEDEAGDEAAGDPPAETTMTKRRRRRPGPTMRSRMGR